MGLAFSQTSAAFLQFRQWNSPGSISSDAKYLGIQIDNKLNCNKHISTVAASGQSKLAFLNRNLKGCPNKLRDTAYISLIRPAYIAALFGIHTKKVIRTKLKKFSAEQLDLFQTILGVRQVSQKCYTI